jgi:leucyl-tRNA synthetase
MAVTGLEQLKKRIGSDVENLKFNTVVSSLMKFYNANENKTWTDKNLEQFIIILSPFVPFLAEEMWEKLGRKGSVHQQEWVMNDMPNDVELIEIPVMVNGKVRARLSVAISDAEEKVVSVAMSIIEIQKHLPNGHKKVVYVPGKAVNFVG